MKLNELVEFNSKEKINHTLVKKVAVDQLGIFFSHNFQFRIEYYTGGSKFRNGDTLIVKLTLCLENGKTTYKYTR